MTLYYRLDGEDVVRVIVECDVTASNKVINKSIDDFAWKYFREKSISDGFEKLKNYAMSKWG